MKRNISLIALGFLIGCAGADIKNERVPLTSGAFDKSVTIVFMNTDTKDATFAGDKTSDQNFVADERKQISNELPLALAYDLREKGYKTSTNPKDIKPGTVVVHTKLTEMHHGSGAARLFVGSGAGASRMNIQFRMEKDKNTIADFDIKASSKAHSGWSTLKNFLDVHMADAGKQLTKYFNKRL